MIKRLLIFLSTRITGAERAIILFLLMAVALWLPMMRSFAPPPAEYEQLNVQFHSDLTADYSGERIPTRPAVSLVIVRDVLEDDRPGEDVSEQFEAFLEQLETPVTSLNPSPTPTQTPLPTATQTPTTIPTPLLTFPQNYSPRGITSTVPAQRLFGFTFGLAAANASTVVPYLMARS